MACSYIAEARMGFWMGETFFLVFAFHNGADFPNKPLFLSLEGGLCRIRYTAKVVQITTTSRRTKWTDVD
jgi:hypothetical protein